MDPSDPEAAISDSEWTPETDSEKDPEWTPETDSEKDAEWIPETDTEEKVETGNENEEAWECKAKSPFLTPFPVVFQRSGCLHISTCRLSKRPGIPLRRSSLAEITL
jgi:hypothetical protein